MNRHRMPPERKRKRLNLPGRSGLGSQQIKVIATDEINREGYIANDFDRCFHCKSELFEKLTEIARENNISFVADGFNSSDKSDFRPRPQGGAKIRDCISFGRSWSGKGRYNRPGEEKRFGPGG